MFGRYFIRGREYTDTEVIKGLQCNDIMVEKEFFRSCKACFNKHYMGIRTIRKVGFRDEEDLFQDSFLKLWQEIQSKRIYTHDNCVWRTDRSGIDRCMSASLKTYFMAIAKYKNYEMLREEEIYVSDLPNIIDRYEDDVEEHTAEWVVKQCVNDLSPRCKHILTLFYFEGKSLDEILDIRKENLSKDGLKTGKSKCMKNLKDKILNQFKIYNLKPCGYG